MSPQLYNIQHEKNSKKEYIESQNVISDFFI